MRAWVDCGLMALTFLLSLFVSVETGIVVSIALSMVLCVKQAAITRIKILGRVPGEIHRDQACHPPEVLADPRSLQQTGTSFYEPVDDDEDDGLFPTEELPGILIVRFRDPSLNFGELRPFRTVFSTDANFSLDL